MYNRSKNILSTVLGRKIQLSLPHFNCLGAINPIILFLEKEDFVLVQRKKLLINYLINLWFQTRFLASVMDLRVQSFIELRSLVLREIVMNEPASQCFQISYTVVYMIDFLVKSILQFCLLLQTAINYCHDRTNKNIYFCFIYECLICITNTFLLLYYLF